MLADRARVGGLVTRARILALLVRRGRRCRLLRALRPGRGRTRLAVLLGRPFRYPIVVHVDRVIRCMPSRGGLKYSRMPAFFFPV
eukprot:11990329-Alexandrium_andersonii.AAC.1